MKILLDSVILIDHLNGVEAATKYLRRTEGAVISVITRAEVLSGQFADAKKVVELLDYYPVLIIDREVTDTAAELRRKHRWRLPDAFQAALAQIHVLKLATRNTKDFSTATHPFVLIPYTLGT